VPLEEVLAALDDLVRAGMMRALGVSNFPAWLLTWTLRTQDAEGWAPFVALQAQYSLVERSAELDLPPLARSAGIALTPWARWVAAFSPGATPETARRNPRAASPSGTARAPSSCSGAQRFASGRNFWLITALEEGAVLAGFGSEELSLHHGIVRARVRWALDRVRAGPFASV
jgi:aryl-alcohol dehydrogenase-like predicted oxidoreductase